MAWTAMRVVGQTTFCFTRHGRLTLHILYRDTTPMPPAGQLTGQVPGICRYPPIERKTTYFSLSVLSPGGRVLF